MNPNSMLSSKISIRRFRLSNNGTVNSRSLKGLGLVFFIVGLILWISSNTAFIGLMGFGVILFLAGFYGVRTHK